MKRFGVMKFVMVIAVLVMFHATFATLASADSTVLAQSTCIRSVAPHMVSYTFEQGAGYGRIPGHAVIGWRSPLPPGWRIEGGSYQQWRNENGFQKFLVNGWPWGYRLVYNVCVDRIPFPYA